MLETILAVLLTPYAIGALLLISAICDHRQSQGWGLFWIIVSGAIAHFTFGVDSKLIGYAALAYIPVGVAWSMFRYKRHTNAIVKKAQEGDISESRAISLVKLSENKARITYWIAAWPVSLIGRIVGDVYDAIESVIVRLFKGTYARISADAEAKIRGIKK